MRKSILTAFLVLLALQSDANSSASERFTDNGNGTITDRATGLLWQREDDNQTRNWQSALQYCHDLSLGGNSDWRLPNVKELSSIVDATRLSPSIDTDVFPGTKSSYYWTSTASSLSWSVLFYNGIVNYYDGSIEYYVRCVRP